MSNEFDTGKVRSCQIPLIEALRGTMLYSQAKEMQMMELGTQLKKYRNEHALSQEELAERIFVSRQSISNWETGKTYPDLKSLLLLSEVFSVSLDKLVKGDVEIMKKEIDAQELEVFQRDSTVFAILFIALVILPIPLIKFFGWFGIAAYTILFAVGMYYAVRVERHKKKFDIQTYREIIAFTEGKSLDEIEKARESGKRPYQKLLLSIGAGLLTAAIAVLMIWLLTL